MNPVRGHVWWREDPWGEPQWVAGELSFDPGSGLSLRKGPAEDGWIIPGLVDVHSHLSIGDEDNAPVYADFARENARLEVYNGVLVIREPGSPAPVDPLVGYDGPAPQVIRSGRHIARSKRYLRGLAVELEDQRDLPAEVARQAAAGDGWVKLVGDWIDRSAGADSDLDPLWERSVLVEAVEAAHEAGARVSVHAFSRAVIDDLLSAGVDSIEHGSGMTREHIQEAVRQDIVVTPTIVQIEKFPEFAAAAGSRYPVYARTMMNLFEGRHQWFADLIDEGVQLLPGSDAGGYQPHGKICLELAKWVEYGMSHEDTLAFATWKARDYLGLESLHQGAAANFVVLGTNPELDVAAFADLKQVVLAGRPVG